MHDAIIIGAGHNGLAAAIHLSSRGWKVAVVEQAAVAGGAVKTREVTLPGFRHDLCAMNLSMFAGSAFFTDYKDELLAHGLELVPAADAFATAFPDGSWLGVSAKLDETTARIAAISPKDAEAWRQMVAGFSAQAPHIFGLLGAQMPSLKAAKTIWNARRAMVTGWLFDTARLLLASPRDFLDAHFESHKLKAMMALHMGEAVKITACLPVRQAVGCVMMVGPIAMDSGPVAGSLFQYLLDPFGNILELVKRQ